MASCSGCFSVQWILLGSNTAGQSKTLPTNSLDSSGQGTSTSPPSNCTQILRPSNAANGITAWKLHDSMLGSLRVGEDTPRDTVTLEKWCLGSTLRTNLHMTAVEAGYRFRFRLMAAARRLTETAPELKLCDVDGLIGRYDSNWTMSCCLLREGCCVHTPLLM